MSVIHKHQRLIGEASSGLDTYEFDVRCEVPKQRIFCHKLIYLFKEPEIWIMYRILRKKLSIPNIKQLESGRTKHLIYDLLIVESVMIVISSPMSQLLRP
jgi:hypothetical protein